MNSEQLNLYIENKEPLDQKAISQIMLLIEKYPYFQAAHMLLLKAMHVSQPEKYNGQLKISASFISDKRKLYHFIHTGTTQNVVVEEKKETKSVEKKIETNQSQITKETKPFVKEKDEKIINEKVVETEKVEKAIPIEKKEPIVQKLETEEKTEALIENVIKRPEVRKKVDLSDQEIEKLVNQNSEVRHKKIVSDFFHTPVKEKVEKKTIETEKEPIVKKETSQEVKEKKEFPGKQEIKALLEEKKRNIIQKNEIIIDDKKSNLDEDTLELEEKTSVSDKIETPIKKVETEIPIKKTELIDKQKEISEKKPVQESKKIIKEETKSEESLIKSAQKAEVLDKTSETMSNIFSKIRQIKKEMNIESVQSSETIDINPTNEISKIVKSKKTEEIKGGKKIKESFIGFEESDIKSDEVIGTTINIEKESQISEVKSGKESQIKDETNESEKIKESGITAKDLFKQRLKNKEKSSDFVQLNSEKTSETKSPISKIVENINQTGIPSIKDGEKETFVKKTEPVVKQQETIVVEEKKSIENISTTSGKESESAADAMLKRIAEKKRRMQEEKEREEQEKLQRKEDLLKSELKNEKEEVLQIKTENTDLSSEQKQQNVDIEKVTEQQVVEPTSLKEKKSQSLIDNFIEKVVTLDRIGTKETSIVGDISEKSTEEKDEFMTETLADLLIQQKNYQKAIEIYNKLILKFPEKKTYFAIQIKKTESLIK